MMECLRGIFGFALFLLTMFWGVGTVVLGGVLWMEGIPTFGDIHPFVIVLLGFVILAVDTYWIIGKLDLDSE